MTTSREFFILKPWFASNLMILVYMVILILIGLSINKIYERYYLKLQVKLIEENNQKLELIKLRSNEQLIQLEKQSLEENIKSKNRELAIATMAIVKKNQFLKSILNDLESMESNPLVTRVIRIIKRNFKKEDDWDFFREAFDNSDKDFLKKLKTKHPKLTHNDMRLCAYLRLNLTSKEIAPLFNISSKSVEIKRYRLRKRMDLSRDENLVDYIINL
jgi:DNA-binding CsgD family transcriptional regulator